MLATASPSAFQPSAGFLVADPADRLASPRRVPCWDTSACPVFPGTRYLDWELEDPAGKGVESVRPIRDEIETRIRGLLTELQVPAAGTGS